MRGGERGREKVGVVGESERDRCGREEHRERDWGGERERDRYGSEENMEREWWRERLICWERVG